MTGRLANLKELYLQTMSSVPKNSKQISKALEKLGYSSTPRQTTAFIKNHLNHIVDIVQIKTGSGSYYNAYTIPSGRLNTEAIFNARIF